jgi:signal transduction histidine kinase
MRWAPSLQAQLVLRLAAVLLVAAGVGVAALFHESSQAADALRREELLQRAQELGRLVERGADGTLRVSLSPGLEQAFQAPGGSDLFVIRSEAGNLLATSRPEFAAYMDNWPVGGPEPRYVRVKRFGPTNQEFCALTLQAASPLGTLSVTVARALDEDALAHTVLKEFVRDIAWAIPIFAAAILLVGVWSIRSGLRPLRAVSARAATIAPETTGIRLTDARLPSELQPLVSAFNQALDRLERGLTLQREFTANAAHQLRTPLAVLTAQLNEPLDNASMALLRADVARMNRLIDQLLRIARLDSVPLALDATIDLNAIAAHAVRSLAPWVIGQKRAIGFDAPGEPVWVQGNADAIGDALRNLIENAVGHAPPQTEVTVSVSPDGAVEIADRGPGIATEDRGRIFERFWRGRRSHAGGAGLGLAIVAQIVAAHGGTISVGDAPGGGAVFTLRLTPIDPKRKSGRCDTSS